MKYILFLLVFTSTFSNGNSSLIGEYQAVTETEYSITLELHNNNKAKLTMQLFAIEENEHDAIETLEGKWFLDGEILRLDFAVNGYIEYKIHECLSFKEFGSDGCGFGMKAVTTNTKTAYNLKRYSLWRKETSPSIEK